MTVDEYAEKKAKDFFYNRCTHTYDEGICIDCVEEAIIESCADQKRGAVAALSNVPRRGSATSVVALITYRDAIKAVQASRPESDRGGMEGEDCK